MRGSWHYREADRLLSEAVSWDTDEHQMRGDAVVIAAAQAHATLALVAATVDAAAHPNQSQMVKAIEELTEAIRFTVEYVGTETLPAIEGWSWFDALQKYAPDKAAAFVGRGVTS